MLTSKSGITRYIAAFVFLAAIFGGILWYTNRNRQAAPIFDLTHQFVPKGAESREVDQSLAIFGFSKPLPFFEKENVVQSVAIPKPVLSTTSAQTWQTTNTPVIPGTVVGFRPATSSPITMFLSYHIDDQNTVAIHDAFVDYFHTLGWKETDSATKGPVTPIAFLDPYMHTLITLTLVEIPLPAVKGPQSVLVGLSLRFINGEQQR